MNKKILFVASLITLLSDLVYTLLFLETSLLQA